MRGRNERRVGVLAERSGMDKTNRRVIKCTHYSNHCREFDDQNLPPLCASSVLFVDAGAGAVAAAAAACAAAGAAAVGAAVIDRLLFCARARKSRAFVSRLIVVAAFEAMRS